MTRPILLDLIRVASLRVAVAFAALGASVWCSAMELPQPRTFSPAAYLVTVTNPGPGVGTISSTPAGLECGTTCRGWFPADSALTLNATATEGSEFVRWFGDCEGSAPCSLTIDGPKLVVGSFKHVGSPLSVVRNFLPMGHDGALPYYGRLVSDGTYLYSATAWGGRGNSGLLYRIAPDGSGFHLLHEFVGKPEDGRLVFGGLLLADGVLYGTTRQGGTRNYGTVFRIGADGAGFEVLHSFDSSSGMLPQAGLTLDGDMLWGTTSSGGDGLGGTLFRIGRDGNGFEVLKAFSSSERKGTRPIGDLVVAGGDVYGTLSEGGESPSRGTIFRYRPSDGSLTVLHSFLVHEDGGYHPHGQLLLDGSVLFGMTRGLNSGDYGTVFRINTDGTGFQALHSLAGGVDNGLAGHGSFVLAGGFLYGLTSRGGQNDLGTVFRIATDGTGFELLHSFAGFPSDGAGPLGTMVRLGDMLFGTTSNGGSQHYGVVFKIGLDGSGYQVLRSFASAHSDPMGLVGGLVRDGSTLYGTGEWGGPGGDGCVFRIEDDGSGYQVLHAFPAGLDNGARPTGPLVLHNGELFGLTQGRGAADLGTVFKVGRDASGFAVLHEFSGPPSDGARPVGGLTLDAGTLYGATAEGGANGVGTIFKLATDGSGYQVLAHPSEAEAANPAGSLIAHGGMLYGVSTAGGGDGSVFRVRVDGSGLRAIGWLYEGFQASSMPNAPLALVGDTLFGTTYYGGMRAGSVYSLKTDGSEFTFLHFFSTSSGSVGSYPEGGLTFRDGVLYGTASQGGYSGFAAGTIFRINTDGSGLRALQGLPSSGAAGNFPRGLLTASGDLLLGLTRFGGVGENGVLFSLQRKIRISGRVTAGGVGLDGVRLLGLPGDPETDASGSYSGTVPLWWSGTVTPVLEGRVMEPLSRTYSDVLADQTGQDFAATSCSSIAIAPATFPAGFLGDPYDVQLVASGGQGPYTFSVASGPLPAGLSVDAGTGVVSGTPARAAQTTVSFVVHDAAGCAAFCARTLSFASHLRPVAIDVDKVSVGSSWSDGNGVLEPGEVVRVSPTWFNSDTAARTVSSTAAGFTGPAFAIYTTSDSIATYGSIPPGAQVNAYEATGNALTFRLQLSHERPAPHWDVRFTETLSDGTEKVWTFHVGDSFADVPRSHWAYRFIETIFHNRVTSGCNAEPFEYCPGSTLTRAEMAVLLLMAKHGPAWVPPAPTGSVFVDVPAEHWAAAFIEALVAAGITSGCDVGMYCPDEPISRAQMAVFLLMAKHGPGYVPPPSTGLVFTDVPIDHWAGDFIEQLAAEGITGGCGPGVYCPDGIVTRAEMAVFLTATFGLLLGG